MMVKRYAAFGLESEVAHPVDGLFDLVMYSDYVALEAEVERLTAERDSIAHDSASDRMRIQRLVEGAKQKDADIAALVTALGEYHQAYTNHSEFISESGFDSLGFAVCEITPASRAVAERWLKKER